MGRAEAAREYRQARARLRRSRKWFRLLSAVARPVRSSLSGRARLQLIGTLFDELVVAVVVSPLGDEALSIISLRAASMKERRLYGD